MSAALLDLDQFAVGYNTKGFYIAAPNEAAAHALLAECKRQREEIKSLRETLQQISRLDRGVVGAHADAVLAKGQP